MTRHRFVLPDPNWLHEQLTFEASQEDPVEELALGLATLAEPSDLSDWVNAASFLDERFSVEVKTVPVDLQRTSGSLSHTTRLSPLWDIDLLVFFGTGRDEGAARRLSRVLRELDVPIVVFVSSPHASAVLSGADSPHVRVFEVDTITAAHSRLDSYLRERSSWLRCRRHVRNMQSVLLEEFYRSTLERWFARHEDVTTLLPPGLREGSVEHLLHSVEAFEEARLIDVAGLLSALTVLKEIQRSVSEGESDETDHDPESRRR